MYKGIGHEFYLLSHRKMMTRLRNRYGFKTALNCPFDERFDPDPKFYSGGFFNVFDVGRSLSNFPDNSYDVVWNFCYLHRDPQLIFEMKRVSRRFVLGLVSNAYNAGLMIHELHHWLHKDGDSCWHPERGQKSLMTKQGIRQIFHAAGLKVLEMGYFDVPIWLNQVVTIGEFFGMRGSKGETSLRLPFTPHLLALESITAPFAFIMAHHLYSLGEKP
jgi:hypothetical protein